MKKTVTWQIRLNMENNLPIVRIVQRLKEVDIDNSFLPKDLQVVNFLYSPYLPKSSNDKSEEASVYC